MRSFLTLSARHARRFALFTLFALATTLANPVPVSAAAATHLDLRNVDTSITANRETDTITVDALDGSGQVDTAYGGTVSFTASCGNCFTITPNNSGQGGSSTQYTFSLFGAGDMGTKNFTLTWLESAAGTPRTLAVSSTIAGDEQNGIQVLSNAPTKLDMDNGVQTSAVQNTPQAFGIDILNPQNETNPNTYTGTVTFSASCDDCFTVTPNDGGANTKKYTFKAADNGSKDFQLTWTTAGTGRSFTATGTDLADVPSETRSGINVQQAAATTTTTSTSTTTTTLVPRTKTGQVITGAGAGGGPHVTSRRADNASQFVFSFYAYDPNFTGGVRVATGDINGDGYDDIITAPGAGGGPHVRVFNGKDPGPAPSVLAEFFAYDANFRGGVYVASADVNGDGKDDVITGPGAGGGPHVRMFDGTKIDDNIAVSQMEIRGLMAYATSFTGGVRVAAGLMNEDSNADVVTGPGPGGGPHVRVFNGNTGAEIGGFMAYAANFTGGVYVAADRADEGIVYTGVGPGGGPHVRLFDQSGDEVLGFMAGESTQGAIPAVGESTNNLVSNVFVVSRAQNDAIVRFFSLEDGDPMPGAFPAYNAPIGVFVAVGVL